jgi:outer membrane protein TolC
MFGQFSCGGIFLTHQSLFALALVIFAAFPAFAAEALSAASRKLDFYGALALAMEKSPAIASARAELEIKELELKNSFSAFLPQLDLTAQHGSLDQWPAAPKSDFTSGTQLALTEKLYDNGVSITNYQTAKLQKDIAELEYRNHLDKLILELASEYFSYSLARNLAEVQQEQFDIINKHYQSVAGQFRQGVRTPWIICASKRNCAGRRSRSKLRARRWKKRAFSLSA